MKIPTKLNHINHTNRRPAYQEKFEAREAWHKLVVKVINWKDELLDGRIERLTDKISPKEWNIYCQHMIRTNVTYGRQKVLESLKETRKIIQEHGGFK